MLNKMSLRFYERSRSSSAVRLHWQRIP